MGFGADPASAFGSLGFGAGRETPMLSSTYPNPFFSSSRNLIVPEFLSLASPVAKSHARSYFFFAGAVTARGAAGGIAGTRPITIESAPGGNGLSAFASSRLTCQICVSVSVPL